MARTDVDFLEFTADEVGEVLRAMAALVGTRGWLTLDPAFDDRFPPPSQTALGRLLSGRGPTVPRATWVPAQTDQRRPEPVSLGILHATGSNAVAWLADKGVEIPERWRVVTDHSKRGLVLWVPIDVPDAEVLPWLLTATAKLTRIPLTGDWRAAVHRP